MEPRKMIETWKHFNLKSVTQLVTLEIPLNSQVSIS
jgi:hypothetical protein